MDSQQTRALGAFIRDERKRQKITQIELAALSGVGDRFVRELEHGKDSCQVGLALRVLRTLGLTAAIVTRQETIHKLRA